MIRHNAISLHNNISVSGDKYAVLAESQSLCVFLFVFFSPQLASVSGLTVSRVHASLRVPLGHVTQWFCRSVGGNGFVALGCFRVVTYRRLRQVRLVYSRLGSH